jgi:hypothetical protein
VSQYPHHSLPFPWLTSGWRSRKLCEFEANNQITLVCLQNDAWGLRIISGFHFFPWVNLDWPQGTHTLTESEWGMTEKVNWSNSIFNIGKPIKCFIIIHLYTQGLRDKLISRQAITMEILWSFKSETKMRVWLYHLLALEVLPSSVGRFVPLPMKESLL